MIKIDTHGLKILDASLELCNKIEEAYYLGHEFVKVVHGFNNGTVIQKYIRSGEINSKLRIFDSNVEVFVYDAHDPGVTILKFGKKKWINN